MYKKLICLLLAVAGLLPLTACWDHVEISRLLIVAGIGLDVDSSGEAYHVTVEFINVEAGEGENIEAEMVEGEGDTIHNALQNAMLMAGGTLFGNHCKVIVIGDELARKGIDGIVDMILRSPEYRKTVDILVAKESTAADIFRQKTIKNDIISYEISKILTSNAKSIKNTVATSVYQLHEALLSKCAYSVIPTVYARQNSDEDALSVDGCAVFAGERLRGFLNGEQTKLLQMIAFDEYDMTLSVRDAGLSNHAIDVNIVKSNVYFSPHLQKSGLNMGVALVANATLEDAVLSGIDTTDRQVIEHMQDAIGKQLSADISKLVTEVQSRYGADIFEFYREYQNCYRQEWDALHEDWSSHFRDMEISVAANVRITGSGMAGNYAPDGQDNANALP